MGRQGLVHQRLQLVGAANVAFDADCLKAPGADSFDHLHHGGRRTRGNHDLGTFPGVLLGDGATNAAAGTGHDGDFATQDSRHAPSP